VLQKNCHFYFCNIFGLCFAILTLFTITINNDQRTRLSPHLNYVAILLFRSFVKIRTVAPIFL